MGRLSRWPMVSQPNASSPGAGRAGAGTRPAGGTGRNPRGTGRLRVRSAAERAGGIPPQRGEQHQPFQERLVELGGVARHAVHHERPGQVARFAPEFAVDEVADTPGEQSGGHQRTTKSATSAKLLLCLRAKKQCRQAHAQKAAVERHAALPYAHDIERVREDVLPAVKQNVAEPSAGQHAQATVEDQVVDHLGRKGAAGPAAPALRQPPGGDEAHQVHQSVPADGPAARCAGLRDRIRDIRSSLIKSSAAQPAADAPHRTGARNGLQLDALAPPLRANPRSLRVRRCAEPGCTRRNSRPGRRSRSPGGGVSRPSNP